MARKQMSVTLEYILEATRARRWEYGRNGEGMGFREVANSDSGSICALVFWDRDRR